MLKDELYAVGFVSRTHGFSGEVIIALQFSVSKSLKIKFLFIEIDGGVVPFLVEHVSRNDDTMIVKLEDLDTSMKASKLTGAQVYLEKRHMVKPSAQQKLEQMIIGFRIDDEIHGFIGLVDDVADVAGKQLIVCIRNGKEMMIPAEKPILIRRDEIKKTLFVKLPEGLLDIYS